MGHICPCRGSISMLRCVKPWTLGYPSKYLVESMIIWYDEYARECVCGGVRILCVDSEWETLGEVMNILSEKGQIRLRRTLGTQLEKRVSWKHTVRQYLNIRSYGWPVSGIWEDLPLRISSLSCRVASTDIPDPLSPFHPIVHRFWQVLRSKLIRRVERVI